MKRTIEAAVSRHLGGLALSLLIGAGVSFAGVTAPAAPSTTGSESNAGGETNDPGGTSGAGETSTAEETPSGDQGPIVAPEARITYLTGTSIYVDAGREEGIQVDQELEVLRAGAVLARLRVTYVSSHRASCVLVSGETELHVGDTVRYRPEGLTSTAAARALVTPAVQASPPPPPRRRQSVMRELGLKGRVGVRYLYVRNRKLDNSGFTQPALDLRLDGTQIAGSPFDINVDVRARRTYRQVDPSGSGSASQTRIYRLSSSWQLPGSGLRVTAGRQISPSLATLNIFDGIGMDWLGDRWNAGALAGSVPEPDLSGASDIREYGSYVEIHNLPRASRRWSVTSGLVGSYEKGEINREFVYLQGRYLDRMFSAWVTEEIDVNRGWRKTAEGSTLSATSTFATFRFHPGQVWTFDAGYDNRRNVRLYRDLITPETEFDDEYRTGVWAGASARIAGHYRIGLSARTNTSGTGGSADSQTLTLGAERLTHANLDFRSRSTRYSSDRADGWLHSLSAGLPVGRRWYFELNGGMRRESDPADPAISRDLNWVGFDSNLNLAPHWYLWLSLERSSGSGDEANDQAYFSVAYRF